MARVVAPFLRTPAASSLVHCASNGNVNYRERLGQDSRAVWRVDGWGFTLKQLDSRQVLWLFDMLAVTRAPSQLDYESMKRTGVRCRGVLVASIMFLLVGVTALSTATRQPCLRTCTGPWHTYKASHMAESGQHGSAATEAAEPAEDVVAETEASRPLYFPDGETLPTALLLTFQRNHFRSPPELQ